MVADDPGATTFSHPIRWAAASAGTAAVSAAAATAKSPSPPLPLPLCRTTNTITRLLVRRATSAPSSRAPGGKLCITSLRIAGDRDSAAARRARACARAGTIAGSAPSTAAAAATAQGPAQPVPPPQTCTIPVERSNAGSGPRSSGARARTGTAATAEASAEVRTHASTTNMPKRLPRHGIARSFTAVVAVAGAAREVAAATAVRVARFIEGVLS